MYAAGNKVDNLIVSVDLNGQQIYGSTDNVLPMGNV
jgi:transketolase